MQTDKNFNEQTIKNEFSFCIENLSKAISRLNEVMLIEKDAQDFNRDACIKRFQFNYEACRKTLEVALKSHGIDINFIQNPYQGLKFCLDKNFIKNKILWETIIKDRLDSDSENYLEKADEIYSRIPAYATEFKIVLEKLEKLNA